MSTIPGGCFVAPDSLRRLNQLQKQHAREAKMQQAGGSTQSPPASPLESPPISPLAPRPPDHPKSSTLSHLITTVPMRLSEIIGRTRSMSSPQPTPPASPPLSPQMPRPPSKEGLNVSKSIDIPQSGRREGDENRNLLSESI